MKKKGEKGWRNNATLIFERIYEIFFKAEERLKRLTQQCNTDFHTSTFYHQKSWVSFLYMSLLWCNNATQKLKRTYEILGKKAEKGWRNNATLIFEHIYQIFWKKLRKGWISFLYTSLLWCNNATQNLKRTYEILGGKAENLSFSTSTVSYEFMIFLDREPPFQYEIDQFSFSTDL